MISPPSATAHADPVGDQPPDQPFAAAKVQKFPIVVRSGLPIETLTSEHESGPIVRSVGHRLPGFASGPGAGVTCASSAVAVGAGGLGSAAAVRPFAKRCQSK